jgi:hypothetical protein
MVLRRASRPEFKNHAGVICSAENPAPERNPGQKLTRTDAIFLNSSENELTVKKNLIRKYFELQIYPTNQSLDHPNLVILKDFARKRVDKFCII